MRPLEEDPDYRRELPRRAQRQLLRRDIYQPVQRGLRRALAVLAALSGDEPAGSLAIAYLRTGFSIARRPCLVLAATVLADGLSRVHGMSAVRDWIRSRRFERALGLCGIGSGGRRRAVDLLDLLTRYRDWPGQTGSDAAADPALLAGATMRSVLGDPVGRSLAGVNSHGDAEWFHRGGFGDLIWWLFVRGLLSGEERGVADQAEELFRVVAEWMRSMEGSGYRVESLVSSSTVHPQVRSSSTRANSSP